MKRNYKNMTRQELKALKTADLAKIEQIKKIEENKTEYDSLTKKQKIWLLDRKIDLTIEIQDIDSLL